MIHLKDILMVVIDRWLNNKNLICMDTIKSIFVNLSIGSALVLLGNLLVVVSFGIEGELTEIIYENEYAKFTKKETWFDAGTHRIYGG